MLDSKKIIILSSSRDATSDYLIAKLDSAGISTFRIDTDLIDSGFKILVEENNASIFYKDSFLSAQKISKIILRRPTPIKISLNNDKAQSFHIGNELAVAIESAFFFVKKENWINHPSINVLASNKPYQLICAKKIGLKTPHWIVSSIENELIKFYKIHSESVIVTFFKNASA